MRMSKASRRSKEYKPSLRLFLPCSELIRWCMTGGSRTKRTLFMNSLLGTIYMSPPLPLFYVYLFFTCVSKYTSEMSGEIESQKWCLYKSSEKLSEMSGKEDNPVLCPDKDLKIYVRNVRRMKMPCAHYTRVYKSKISVHPYRTLISLLFACSESVPITVPRSHG